MTGGIVAPTVWTIMFMLIVGLWGFIKFSHENAAIRRPAMSIVPAPYSQVPVTSTPINHDGSALAAQDPISELGHDHPAVEPARTLITYAYSESPSARENLMFFLDNGLHSVADFVFILSGPTDVAKFIPAISNVQVISRSDDCFGLGAHAEVLRKDGLWKKYSRFITLSADVRGPFVPYWSRSCWSDVFLGLITDDVKLVGMTAKCLPKFHIPSMIWATDSIGMSLLLQTSDVDRDANQVAFRGCHGNPTQLARSEVEATAVIEQAGYEVDALMTAFRKSEDHKKDCAKRPVDDLIWEKQHYDSRIHPYETIFAQADDAIDSITVARLTEWHEFLPTNGSWDVCRRGG
ncbi:hypothetical protein GGR52DRAFT_569157 [Hypoxylon sp. FL1284]|nr:hypothetical protein GGR52DRAFT_569157 [Hypoxylon sp. FL1284]